ncbi:hypothetical protein RHSIM_Rhsim01G0070400 [Rhododendron simsii]|uniref:MYB transcription factor n=1 Tax=Rhododendron simsii TaxID=118357 RepID=A0A834HGJ3_RHOSS|nr:hypothetical protein RHSIM_Rhsim01G0070400 [Rhododendron simsii]
MKASSCPNLNRETTSYPNFFTLFQHPDHHQDTTLYKLRKIGHGDDTTLSKSPKTIDTELSVTSPIKGILSTSLSVNETNENHYRIVGFFPEWDQKDPTLLKGPPSPNGSDTGVSVGSNEDIITSVSVTTLQLLKVKRGENLILRAQVVELSHRLQSLNEIAPQGYLVPWCPHLLVTLLLRVASFHAFLGCLGLDSSLMLAQVLADQELCRRQSVPWTEEEHRLFLLGLQKLGKGDWRGISRSYVTSRTPTQVASHAQRYFIRRSNAIRRKRRSSLFNFDKDTDQPPRPEEQFMLPPSKAFDTDTSNSFPSLKLSLSKEFEPMETTSEEKVEEEAKETTTPLGEFPTADGQR